MCQSKVRCLFVFASRCHPDRAKRRGISLRFPPSSKSDYLQPKSVFLSSIFRHRTHTTRSHSPTESSPLVVIPTERSDEGPLFVSRHHPKAITCNRNLSFSPPFFCSEPTPRDPTAQRSRRLSLSSRQSAATRDLSPFPAIIQKRLPATEICLSLLYPSAPHPCRKQSRSPTEPSPLVVIPTERSDEGPLFVSRHHLKAITYKRNLSFSPLSFCSEPTPNAIPYPNGVVASRCHPDRAQRRGISLRFPPSSRS
jgi:hypothetical protein